MDERDSISEILETYKRHGWELRRVLLSPELKERLGNTASSLFGDAEVRESDTDAAWFSRRSRPGVVAWELRRFGGTPFAIFRNVPDDTRGDEFEAILKDAERDSTNSTTSRSRYGTRTSSP